MRLDLGACVVRSWEQTDAAALARHADNRHVWINLRDQFPHPYTAADAERWLGLVREQHPATSFAVDVAGEAVGAIGYYVQPDVARRSAEIGYWLSEAYWGRGIMTAAVRGVSAYAFATSDLCRLYAGVFAWNPASMRVLEKAGYVKEGVLRRSVVKDGRVIDQVLYALTREP